MKSPNYPNCRLISQRLSYVGDTDDTVPASTVDIFEFGIARAADEGHQKSLAMELPNYSGPIGTTVKFSGPPVLIRVGIYSPKILNHQGENSFYTGKKIIKTFLKSLFDEQKFDHSDFKDILPNVFNLAGSILFFNIFYR